jgi:signal transduction histidine kinase
VKRRLAVVLVLLVLLPVAALSVLGARLIMTEREQGEARTRALLIGQLAQHDARIQEVLEARALACMRALPETNDIEEAHALLTGTGAVRHVFLLLAGQQLIFPTSKEVDRLEAGAFNRYVTGLWRNRDPGFIPLGESGPVSSGKAGNGKSASSGMIAVNQGWQTWYDESGLRFLFWWRQANDTVVGAELDQVRLMADLIAALPDTAGPGDRVVRGYEATPARVVLIDARGQEVYRWGIYPVKEGEHPAATLGLSTPFRAWRLDAFMEAAHGGGGLAYAMTLGLGALLVALAGLGFYFYRESTRALRDAAQRVTFANQVSHELKTPLTNIRLYAELLEEDIEPEGRARERLHIIVSESQRLSRLIGNILTFSQKQRHKLCLRPKAGRVGETVAGVLAHARPALLQRGIETQVVAPQDSEARVYFDPDVVEQVLNNLVSNVEKYAAGGGYLGVCWSRENGVTRICVEDRGPGVPEGEEDRIFLPFYRVSNRLTDGVSGTGIGLALARDLCRLHGGDLTMTRRGEGGLCFEVTLDTPLALE